MLCQPGGEAGAPQPGLAVSFGSPGGPEEGYGQQREASEPGPQTGHRGSSLLGSLSSIASACFITRRPSQSLKQTTNWGWMNSLYRRHTSQVAQRVKNLLEMQEAQIRSLGQEDLLEKEVATHSSLLAWRIPWTAEPGGL